MNELRKLEKAIKYYTILITEEQEEARKNKEYYSEDVDILLEYTNNYIEILNDEFKQWCYDSVEVFKLPEDNIIQAIKKKALMFIVNYYLNSISGEMVRAGKIKTSLEVIARRFKQYIHMIH